MIDPATGMKPGERYAVESLEPMHHFPGFFLDGKYYLGPELLTAVGWLEGKQFVYDELDSAGEPVFPERIAGTIHDLTLTLADGAVLALTLVQFSATLDTPGVEPMDAPIPTDSRPLHGKVVVITGASSGIGRTAAHAFSCEGARLVLAARDEQALFDVLDECTECGTDAVAVVTDVTSSEQMVALAARAADFGNGRIDIWINNAGVGAVGSFEQTPLEAHEQVIQTDLLGYLRGAYVAWPYFKTQKNGTLINTLSLGSWVAQPYAVAYSASKFGLRGLTEALRGELNGFPDIHVCDIYPAVMDTPGFRDGGNYTGHALKPPPPLYDPRLVAKAMVACAIRPRASTTVGNAAHVSRLLHFLVPGFTRLAGWLTRSGIGRSPAAVTSSGNLFTPPEGVRRVDGYWREQSHGSPVAVAAAAVVIAGGLIIWWGRRRGPRTRGRGL